MSSYVYFALDPRTEPFTRAGYSLPHTPYYIGKGTGKRYKVKKNILVNKLVEDIKSSGFEPVYVIIPFGEDETNFSNEAHFISCFGRQDLGTGPLLNLDVGGKGVTYRRSWNKGKTKDSDPRLATSAEKRRQTMEGREPCRPWNKGLSYTNKPLSESTKKKISERHRQKWRVYCPDGHIINTDNLKEFALERGLEYENLTRSSRTGIKCKGYIAEKIG